MAYGSNSPLGLQPSVTLTGSTWSGQLSEYQIQSNNNGVSPSAGYGTSLFTGDPVTFLNDGTIGIATPNAPVVGVFMGCKYTLPQGQSGYNGPFVFSPYWQANTHVQQNTQISALIVDDPNVLFDIQSSNSNPNATTAAACQLGVRAADVGKNANFAIGGTPFTDAIVPQNPASGNTINGQSRYYLDLDSISTTGSISNLNLKIVRLTPIVTPSITNQGPKQNVYYPASPFVGLPVYPAAGQFNNVLVALNNDFYKGGNGTLGGVTYQTASGNILAADFLTAAATPIQIIAPVAGATIIVNKFILTMTYNSSAYAAGGNVGLEYGNAANLAGPNFASSKIVPSAFYVNSAGTYNFTFNSVPVSLTNNVNTGIFLSNAAPAFITGDSNFSWTVQYAVIPV